MRRNKRVGIIKGNLVILPEKSEPQVLFGAGDFSPPNAYIFGTKVPCSERFAPCQIPIYLYYKTIATVGGRWRWKGNSPTGLPVGEG